MSSNNAQDTATLNAQSSSLQQAVQQAQQSGSRGATYTSDQYTGWANDIYQQGISNIVNQSAIVSDIVNVNTMVDLQSLISAFGIRPAATSTFSACSLLGLNCTSFDLPSFVKQVLDNDHINNINLYLTEQGINYQF